MCCSVVQFFVHWKLYEDVFLYNSIGLLIFEVGLCAVSSVFPPRFAQLIFFFQVFMIVFHDLFVCCRFLNILCHVFSFCFYSISRFIIYFLSIYFITISCYLFSLLFSVVSLLSCYITIPLFLSRCSLKYVFISNISSTFSIVP